MPAIPSQISAIPGPNTVAQHKLLDLPLRQPMLEASTRKDAPWHRKQSITAAQDAGSSSRCWSSRSLSLASRCLATALRRKGWPRPQPQPTDAFWRTPNGGCQEPDTLSLAPTRGAARAASQSSFFLEHSAPVRRMGDIGLAPNSFGLGVGRSLGTACWIGARINAQTAPFAPVAHCQRHSDQQQQTQSVHHPLHSRYVGPNPRPINPGACPC